MRAAARILLNPLRWKWSLKSILLLTTLACIALAEMSTDYRQRSQLIQREVDAGIRSAQREGPNDPMRCIQDMRVLDEQIRRTPLLFSADRIRHLRRIAEVMTSLEKRQLEFEQQRRAEFSPCH